MNSCFSFVSLWQLTVLHCNGDGNNDSYTFLRSWITSGVAIVDNNKGSGFVCARLKFENIDDVRSVCKVW